MLNISDNVQLHPVNTDAFKINDLSVNLCSHFFVISKLYPDLKTAPKEDVVKLLLSISFNVACIAKSLDIDLEKESLETVIQEYNNVL